jgi:hypothetical protein
MDMNDYVKSHVMPRYPVENVFSLDSYYNYPTAKLVSWLNQHDIITCTRRSCDTPKEEFRRIARKHDAQVVEIGNTMFMYARDFAATCADPSDDNVLMIFCANDRDPPKDFEIFISLDSGPRVLWFYHTSQGLGKSRMKVEGNDPLPCFYPWIDDLEKLYRDFYDSPASVLLLMGDPGTGKTTFLRGLVRRLRMEAWVTYDEKVHTDEAFYTKFGRPGDEPGAPSPYDETSELKEDRGRVLILEDSDAMLEKRRDGNKLMSRILNLSDGLVALPKRKIVFTTNISSLTAIDEALLRPGRCYGVIRFRPLHAAECAEVCRVLGRKSPVLTQATTLADLLNEGKCDSNAVRRIGFA